MNLLAFDTSTEWMSIGVSREVDGRVLQWLHTGAGGAQASTGLIPAVLDLLHQADLPLTALDAICFGSGPGSFTGLRTACSVAQGLAFGARVPVLPVESLLAVAEEARYTAHPTLTQGDFVALLDARMDELYVASYTLHADQWTPRHTSRLVRPEDLHLAPLPSALAGNVFEIYGERIAQAWPDANPVPRTVALPTAAAMLRLAPQLLAQGRAVSAEQALPIYIRDKVAKTTVERADEKAVASAAAVAAASPIH
jgi:tRNA threonylcarbamoyladenosine biosynthesis protein TsaB